MIYDIDISLRFALLRAAWMNQSEEALLRKYQSQLEAIRHVVAGRAWNDVYRPPVGADCSYSYYLNGDFGWFERALRVAMQFETRRQMTLTAIALKRFEMRYSHLPADLKELVPEFLAELPRDYMTDQPLRYRLKAEREFILYSVGDDGRDDGGDTSRRLSPGFLNPFAFQLWDSRDAVWPVAITQEEFEKSQSKGMPRMQQNGRSQR
jgi:hypothetical protein